MIQIAQIPSSRTVLLQPLSLFIYALLALLLLVLPFFLAFATPAFYDPLQVRLLPLQLQFDQFFSISVEGPQTSATFTNLGSPSQSQGKFKLGRMDLTEQKSDSDLSLRYLMLQFEIHKEDQPLQQVTVALNFNCSVLNLSMTSLLIARFSGQNIANAYQKFKTALFQRSALNSSTIFQSYPPQRSNGSQFNLQTAYSNYISRNTFIDFRLRAQSSLEELTSEARSISRFKIVVVGEAVEALVQRSTLVQVEQAWEQYIAIGWPIWTSAGIVLSVLGVY